MQTFKSYENAVAYFTVALNNVDKEIEEKVIRREEILRLLNHNKKMQEQKNLQRYNHDDNKETKA